MMATLLLKCSNPNNIFDFFAFLTQYSKYVSAEAKKDKCPINPQHVYTYIPCGLCSNILNTITSSYSQFRKQKIYPMGSNSTLLTPLGFQFTSDLNMKTKQEKMSHFPKGAPSFSFSPFVIFLHNGCFYPASNAVDIHYTQTLTEELKQEKQKEKHTKNRCTPSHTYANTHTQVYTDAEGPISGSCQQQDRGYRKHRMNSPLPHSITLP